MRVNRIIAATFVVSLVLCSQAFASVPLTTRIAETQVSLWRCQDQRAVPRTRPSVTPWALPRSRSYRAWTLNLWQLRKRDCIKQLHAHDAVIRALQRGLRGTPMAGTERALEAAGRRWHIHPAFIAAIAGTESSFGFASCSGNPYNAYGLSSCTTGWSVPYFRSWAASYEFMGHFLSSRWPHARSPYDFHGYAKCSSCWGRKTVEHMQRFGVGSSIIYF